MLQLQSASAKVALQEAQCFGRCMRMIQLTRLLKLATIEFARYDSSSEVHR